VLAAALFLVLALRFDPERRVIHGVDGVGYSLHVRSLLIDGDLDFADEIDRVHPGELPGGGETTATGLRPDKYAVGVSLLAAPFFAAARLVDRWTGASGAEHEEGWTLADRIAIAVSSIVWGWVGLVLSYRVARRFAGARASAVAVTLLAIGTHALYYLVREPFLSHLDAIFALSLALLLTLRAAAAPPASAPGAWAAAGAAAGLAASVRLTALLFAVVPASLLVRRARLDGRAPGSAAAALALGGLLGLAPQLLAWRVLYGSWWVDAYQGEAFTNLFSPRVLEVLFSSRHGLLSWSPLLLLAVAGLPRLVKTNPGVGHAMVAWALLLLYANAGWEQWWLGHSFGHRGFLCLFPLFAVALAVFLDGPAAALPRAALAAAIAAAVAWNGLLMVAYLAEVVPYSGSFSWWDFVGGIPDLPDAVLRKVEGGG
jgi:hypothetical protein